jgi:histidine triad (HIT) family protein
MDCIFCKIINKEIPNFTVFEDENVLAFLDIFPHAKGHTVVIPKKHFADSSEMNGEDWKKFCSGIKKARDRIAEVLSPDGFNVGWNESPEAGQVVPHLHVHIFPRYKGDGGGSVHSIIKNPGGLSPKELHKKFESHEKNI